MLFKVLVLNIALMSIGMLSFEIRAESSKQQVGEAAKLANEIYTDPKGYFKIRPPAGWTVEEHETDPRGKVNFNSTEGGKEIQLKVIGAANPLWTSTNSSKTVRMVLSAFVHAWAEHIARSVETITLFGQKAALILTSLPNGFKQYQVQLIAGGNYYTMAYGTDRQVYEKYLPLAKASMETLEALPKQAKPEETRDHTIATKIRLAQLYVQIGRKDWALTAVNEGLNFDPENKELLSLKKQITDK